MKLFVLIFALLCTVSAFSQSDSVPQFLLLEPAFDSLNKKTVSNGYYNMDFIGIINHLQADDVIYFNKEIVERNGDNIFKTIYLSTGDNEIRFEIKRGDEVVVSEEWKVYREEDKDLIRLEILRDEEEYFQTQIKQLQDSLDQVFILDNDLELLRLKSEEEQFFINTRGDDIKIISRELLELKEEIRSTNKVFNRKLIASLEKEKLEKENKLADLQAAVSDKIKQQEETRKEIEQLTMRIEVLKKFEDNIADLKRDLKIITSEIHRLENPPLQGITYEFNPSELANPSTRYTVRSSEIRLNTMNDLYYALEKTLEDKEYYENTYHIYEGGFVIITKPEQIDYNQKIPHTNRWSNDVGGSVRKKVTLANFLRDLFYVERGYYRTFVFIVIDKPFKFSGQVSELNDILSSGQTTLDLDDATKINRHNLVIGVYEFVKTQNDKMPRIIPNSEKDGKFHLEKAGLWKGLEQLKN